MQEEDIIIEKLLFNDNNIDKDKITKLISSYLSDLDDGELFLEYNHSENFSFNDKALKNSSSNISSGFGLRGIVNDVFSYSHSSKINYAELDYASKIVGSIKNYSESFKHDLTNNHTPSGRSLYDYKNPLIDFEFAKKIDILAQIDDYLRSKNELVKQVSASVAGSWQAVAIIDKYGNFSSDIRPLVRLNISVIVEENGRMESGTYGAGGRQGYMNYLDNWQSYADSALSIALTNLDAIDSPAGTMPVVLGSGWPGILLHEAVGHGLEGDFNRKKTSIFSELVGKRVASPGVTVIDDGTIKDRRGSLNIDDEGNSSGKNILIEDGILKSFIQDKMNARLMNVKPTGNGRRENYASPPMPRMTNTYMLAGEATREDIISSVKRGIYAVNFGGGQVDITSGKFVFSSSEAYLIEDGKVTSPVKGATLIGNGPDVLTKVSMIGNDLALDPGIGTCGKAGQSVPVGVGQPSLLIDSITVGGTSI